jgi:hypothetical protein
MKLTDYFHPKQQFYVIRRDSIRRVLNDRISPAAKPKAPRR